VARYILPITEEFIDSYNGNSDEALKPSGKVALITRVVRVDLYSSASGLALAFSPFSEGEWRLNDPKTNC
jgi:hypothetical protein